MAEELKQERANAYGNASRNAANAAARIAGMTPETNLADNAAVSKIQGALDSMQTKKSTEDFLSGIANKQHSRSQITEGRNPLVDDGFMKIVGERASQADSAIADLANKRKMRNIAKGGLSGELSEELVGNINQYRIDHPELSEQYPDFDSLAKYYMEQNGIQYPQVDTTSIDRAKGVNPLNSVLGPAGSIPTEIWLDALTKRRRMQ